MPGVKLPDELDDLHVGRAVVGHHARHGHREKAVGIALLLHGADIGVQPELRLAEPVLHGREAVLDGVVELPLLGQAQLVAQQVVLPVPDKQLFARGRLPVKGVLLLEGGVIAVVGVQAAQEVFHPRVQKGPGKPQL